MDENEWAERWTDHMRTRREESSNPDTSDAQELIKLRAKLRAGEEWPLPDFD